MTIIGNAKLIGNFDPGSTEWHNLRRDGIGGSEIGVIAGLNKWQSAYSLWATKTGQVSEDYTDNDAMLWGRILEPVILDRFTELHPELAVTAGGGTYANIEHPWQHANPDGFYEAADGTKGIIEIKTAMYEEDWANGVPKTYMTQIQWYLRVFGYKSGWVVVLFHGNKYAEYPVTFDEFASDSDAALAEVFLNNVRNGTAPEWDGSKSTYETVRILHPQIDPDLTVELGELGVHYFNAVADFAEKEQLVTELKSRILDAMGDAKTGLVYDEPMVTRQARGSGAPYLVNKRNA
jgi:putative phage-type endonuclease